MTSSGIPICLFILIITFFWAHAFFGFSTTFGAVWGGSIGVAIICVFVLALCCRGKRRRSYPNVDGANIVDSNVPIPSPESAPGRQSGDASSIPTSVSPPIHMSSLPATQTSPISGAMFENPGAEPAQSVQQPGSDAVGFLQYEDGGIRMPPPAHIPGGLSVFELSTSISHT